MPLPVLTTVDDVKEIVKYLKNKPTGATVTEAKAALKKEVLDARKISGYVFWQFVQKDGERLKLTQRGWELARTPENEAKIFQTVLNGVIPYRSALEWAYHQNLESITNIDVAAHWHENHGDILGTDKDVTIKDGAVCFFRLCQAAGLGKLIVGRKGQSTRLSMNREQLGCYIETAASSCPHMNPQSEISEPIEETHSIVSSPVVENNGHLRVFISHGKNIKLVEQIQTMLDLSGIKSRVAEKEETAAIPVPEKIFNAMRECRAGIIVVSAEEGRKDVTGNYALNENVLIEIGAAFVLYDRRVILLWDKRLSVPSNLQGLYRCEFEGSELTWDSGVKLMKAVQGFKKFATSSFSAENAENDKIAKQTSTVAV